MLQSLTHVTTLDAGLVKTVRGKGLVDVDGNHLAHRLWERDSTEAVLCNRCRSGWMVVRGCWVHPPHVVVKVPEQGGW